MTGIAPSAAGVISWLLVVSVVFVRDAVVGYLVGRVAFAGVNDVGVMRIPVLAPLEWDS
jgi:hypothetical protein